MRKLLILLLLFVLCSQSEPLRYRRVVFPDPVPYIFSDVYSLDTLLSGYWKIQMNGKEIYPTLIAYRVQEDMASYTDWPSVDNALDRSWQYFRAGTGRARKDDKYGAYYEDKYIRVFVKER